MTRPDRRGLIINVNVLNVGIHAAAWQRTTESSTAFVDPDYYVRQAQIAERGTLDAVFLADGPALRENPAIKPSQALDPGIILGSVAAGTERLGIIGTFSTTFNEPVELAHRLLSLDRLSGGRFAWNIVTTYSASAGANFGLADLPDRETRYRRAGEFVDLVRALWRSASTAGVPGPAVAHEGEFFSAHGRLGQERSAQGEPLLVQAGGSPQGRDLAGAVADAVFTAELDLGAAIDHHRYVSGAAVRSGRAPDAVKILPGLITTIGSSHAEAERRAAEQDALLPEGFAAQRLSQVIGEDLARYDLHEPFPRHLLEPVADPARFGASLGFRESIVRVILARDLTVGEAVRAFSGSGHRVVVGTPEDVADTIEHWYLAGAADGVNLMPDVFPDGLEIFVDEVVPLLRERGIFRYDYTESTLRERYTRNPSNAPSGRRGVA
ncbi:LLM class flavin-dependent oxidoreductase [Gordonia insulae]|uniref:Nitrilotriacetate monooxygenase component A n=1 Tax=Gordonia insulae TaxID=2420509 RepID=A0A3G8JHM0_9ACTN|nr:LLM class flavin-dependent oxidoreductase [Gordonia insulae]AZG44012.1 Nitrilotriacetate monooxygenase component A [Gordonia insulae]